MSKDSLAMQDTAVNAGLVDGFKCPIESMKRKKAICMQYPCFERECNMQLKDGTTIKRCQYSVCEVALLTLPFIKCTGNCTVREDNF